MVSVFGLFCHIGMIFMITGTGILVYPQSLQATPAAVAKTAPGHFPKPKIGCTRSGPKSGPAIVWQAPGPGTERLPDHRPGDEVDPHVHLLYLWEMLGQIGHLSFVRISRVNLSGAREPGYSQIDPLWDPSGIWDPLVIGHEMTLGPDQQHG